MEVAELVLLVESRFRARFVFGSLEEAFTATVGELPEDQLQAIRRIFLTEYGTAGLFSPEAPHDFRDLCMESMGESWMWQIEAEEERRYWAEAQALSGAA